MRLCGRRSNAGDRLILIEPPVRKFLKLDESVRVTVDSGKLQRSYFFGRSPPQSVQDAAELVLVDQAIAIYVEALEQPEQLVNCRTPHYVVLLVTLGDAPNNAGGVFVE